jgi:hypothetical protein
MDKPIARALDLLPDYLAKHVLLCVSALALGVISISIGTRRAWLIRSAKVRAGAFIARQPHSLACA